MASSGTNRIYDVLIIKGGPAEYTAALYAARTGLDVLVLERLSAGGQIALSAQVDNYPGFENGVDGFWLGEKMQLGAERFGARTELTEAEREGRVEFVWNSVVEELVREEPGGGQSSGLANGQSSGRPGPAASATDSAGITTKLASIARELADVRAVEAATRSL